MSTIELPKLSDIPCGCDEAKALRRERDEALAKVAELEAEGRRLATGWDSAGLRVRELTASESALTRQHAVEVERLTGERDMHEKAAKYWHGNYKRDIEQRGNIVTALESELAASREKLNENQILSRDGNSPIKATGDMASACGDCGRERGPEEGRCAALERNAMFEGRTDECTRLTAERLKLQVTRLTSELEAARGYLQRIAASWEAYQREQIDQEEFEGTVAEVYLSIANDDAPPCGNPDCHGAHTAQPDETPELSGDSGEVREIVVGSTWEYTGHGHVSSADGTRVVDLLRAYEPRVHTRATDYSFGTDWSLDDFRANHVWVSDPDPAPVAGPPLFIVSAPLADYLFYWETESGAEREGFEYSNLDSCRGCGEGILPENRRIADGCPCNSPRGINHGLVPKLTCTCVECDPEKTGGTRHPLVSDPAPQPPPVDPQNYACRVEPAEEPADGEGSK